MRESQRERVSERQRDRHTETERRERLDNLTHRHKKIEDLHPDFFPLGYNKQAFTNRDKTKLCFWGRKHTHTHTQTRAHTHAYNTHTQRHIITVTDNDTNTLTEKTPQTITKTDR